MPTTKTKNKKPVAVKSEGKVSVKKEDSLAVVILRLALNTASKEDKKAIRAQLKQLESFKKPIPENVGADSDKPAKAALLRSIRSKRQKLNRELLRGETPKARKVQLRNELENLRLLEHQECGIEDPPRRPTARELGFWRSAPSVKQIRERAVIHRSIDQEKFDSMLPKLASIDKDKWRIELSKEEKREPKVLAKRKRMDCCEISKEKLSEQERVVLENYFGKTRLSRPLRELGVKTAVKELREKLRNDVTEDEYRHILGKYYLTE